MDVDEDIRGGLNETYVISKGGGGEKHVQPEGTNVENSSKISEEKQVEASGRVRKTSKKTSAKKNVPQGVGKQTSSETKDSVSRKRGEVSEEHRLSTVVEETSNVPTQEDYPQKRPRRRTNDEDCTSQQENNEGLKALVEKKKGMKNKSTKLANEDLKEPVERKTRGKVKGVSGEESATPRTRTQLPDSTSEPSKTLQPTKTRRTRVHVEHCTS